MISQEIVKLDVKDDVRKAKGNRALECNEPVAVAVLLVKFRDKGKTCGYFVLLHRHPLTSRWGVACPIPWNQALLRYFPSLEL